MKLISKILFVTIMLLLPTNAHAQSKYWAEGVSATYDKCRDKIGGQTYEMLRCGNAELTLQELELTKVYSELAKNLQQKELEELEKAQRDWMAFRKSTCELMALPERGGSLASVISTTCNLIETARRVKVIKGLKG